MINNVVLVGRLTKDIELRYTPSGAAVASFTLVVNRNFTNSQGEREADFIQMAAWRKTAELLAQFTRKGSQVGIQGRIQTRNFKNKDGQTVYVTEVVAENVTFLDGKRAGNSEERTKQRDYPQNNQNGAQGQNETNYSATIDDDDLPF